MMPMCPIAPLCDGSKRPGSRSRRLPGLTRGESYEEVLATLQCSLSLFGSTHPAFDHRGDTLALSLPQATIGADAMGSQDFKTRVVERAVLIDLFLRCGLLVAGTRRARSRPREARLNLWPLPGSRSLLEEAILDRLPYPFLDQSLGRVRYACAVGSELGQLVQVLPGCQGKCYRSAVGVGHAQLYNGWAWN